METKSEPRKKGTWLSFIGKAFKEVAAKIDLNLVSIKAVDMEGGTSILGYINQDFVAASDKKSEDQTRGRIEEDTKAT